MRELEQQEEEEDALYNQDGGESDREEDGLDHEQRKALKKKKQLIENREDIVKRYTAREQQDLIKVQNKANEQIAKSVQNWIDHIKVGPSTIPQNQ